MLKQLLEEYKLFLEENLITGLEFLYFYNKSYLRFKDIDLLNKLLGEIKKYYESSYLEFKLFNHLLFNISKYEEENIYSVLSSLYNIQYEKIIYIEKMFDQLSLAIDMDFKDKFYAPKDKPLFVDQEITTDLKKGLLGFNRHNIYDFLLEEEVIGVDDVENIDSKIREFRLNNSNYSDAFVKVDNFGNKTKIREIYVPKTIDELSMLINVYQLSKVGIFNNYELLQGFDLLNNDIPKFYEALFKLKSDYDYINIKHTDISLKMIEDYKDEPFLEQIEKYKYYVKKM